MKILPSRSCTMLLLSTASCLLARPLFAQHDEHDEQARHAAHALNLGHVTFPNSGNAAAQKPFLQGLALLHSFVYGDAADDFRAAQKADPDFALAYWAEALTNTHVVWGEEDLAAAHAALAKLGDSPAARFAHARTPRERAFGAAVEGLYATGDQRTRVRAFADSMRTWVAAMPADEEANAFAALGIIWQAYFVKGQPGDSLNAEAVKHAQYVFDHNPLHPGAAHYIIHASDSPAAAARGLKAAREYARIAPDAEHALHMPSHIFLPLGMWDEMVSSNERAWAASRAETKRHNSPTWYNDWHSLNWLQYAYLQLGRWKDARALIDTARVLTRGVMKAAEDPDAAFAVEQLAFRYGAETGNWKEFPSASTTIDWSDSTASPRARSMAAASLYQRATVELLTREDTVPAHAASGRIRSVAPRLADLLDESVLQRNENCGSAVQKLQDIQANARVDRYSSMTPGFARNVEEELGGALIAANRPVEAVGVYLRSLADRPGRAASLVGLARAQAASGDIEGARKTNDQLTRMWRRADKDARAWRAARQTCFIV